MCARGGGRDRPEAACPPGSRAADGEAGGFNAVQKLLTNRDLDDLDAATWTQLCHLILDTDRWIPREDAPSNCTHAGCLNGDNPGDGFESVKWISAASLAVTVTDGRRDTWRDTAADVFGCSGMLGP